MKVLYVARYARFDLLRAVWYLAQHITKWDSLGDKRLYRLMCHRNGICHVCLTRWVGDSPKDAAPRLFAGAVPQACQRAVRCGANLQPGLARMGADLCSATPRPVARGMGEGWHD